VLGGGEVIPVLLLPSRSAIEADARTGMSTSV